MVQEKSLEHVSQEFPEFQVADIVEDYNILEEARRVASQIVSDPNWRENPDWQVLGAHLRSQGEFD